VSPKQYSHIRRSGGADVLHRISTSSIFPRATSKPST